MTDSPPNLQGVSDLREFFRTNQTPIYFISPTAFNLLGIDQWVRNFHYVTWYDSFEDRCQQWITGIRAQFAGAPPVSPQAAPASPASFKMA